MEKVPLLILTTSIPICVSPGTNKLIICAIKCILPQILSKDLLLKYTLFELGWFCTTTIRIWQKGLNLHLLAIRWFNQLIYTKITKTILTLLYSSDGLVWYSEIRYDILSYLPSVISAVLLTAECVFVNSLITLPLGIISLTLSIL